LKNVQTYFKVSSTLPMITQGTDVAIDMKLCCPSCNRWVDCSADILISWGCCNIVWFWENILCYSWIFMVSLLNQSACYYWLMDSLTCRLTQSHNGKYLALQLADCLARFGLDSLVRTLLSYDDDGLSLLSIRLIYYAWIMQEIAIPLPKSCMFSFLALEGCSGACKAEHECTHE